MKQTYAEWVSDTTDLELTGILVKNGVWMEYK